MKAIQFDYNVPKYLFTKAAGRFSKKLHWNSIFSCLQYRDVPKSPLPNEKWVRVDVTYGGICGSDLNLLFLNDSPALSPFTSFPFTMGHEAVGIVAATGKATSKVKKGDRVAIDPLLSCAARGVSRFCLHCSEGNYQLCENKTEGNIAPGLLIGACKDTGGSWSQQLVAHESQLFPLPDSVNDENGLLIEPFSCALHAVLQNPPKEGDKVLVIGAGMIGVCVIAAIRALEIPCEITALVKHSFQGEFVSNFGADNIIYLSNNQDYVSTLTSALGARKLKPIYGEDVIVGGADLVYECVGRRQSVQDALRFTRGGGTVVILGLTSLMKELDWTTVWLNELTIKGSFVYGTNNYKGVKRRTFDIALELITNNKVNLAPLITHRFSLQNYEKALSKAVNKQREKVMKVVFQHK